MDFNWGILRYALGKSIASTIPPLAHVWSPLLTGAISVPLSAQWRVSNNKIILVCYYAKENINLTSYGVSQHFNIFPPRSLNTISHTLSAVNVLIYMISDVKSIPHYNHVVTVLMISDNDNRSTYEVLRLTHYRIAASKPTFQIIL